MFTASMPGARLLTVDPMGRPVPIILPRRSTASVCAMSTFLPAAAAALAMAAATVVRPTPPLPESARNCRSISDGGMRPDTIARRSSKPIGEAHPQPEQISEQRQPLSCLGDEGGDAAQGGVVGAQAGLPIDRYPHVESQRHASEGMGIPRGPGSELLRRTVEVTQAQARA